ncbi:MAG: DUF805 domain-containing protein [Pacificimonas sp.]
MNHMLLPLRRYADFNGRSRRREYWMFALFQILVYSGWALFFFAAVPSGLTWTGEPLVLLLLALPVLFLLAMIVPNIAVQVRRFHDMNMSGWFYFLNFIPYVGGFVVLVFNVIDGTRGPNRYGADPKERADQDVLQEVFA